MTGNGTADATNGNGNGNGSGRRPSLLGSLRLPLYLIVGGVLAFSAYYLFYVQRNSTYLANRNLRLLAGAANQVDAKLRDYERVVESFVLSGRMEEIGGYVPDLGRHAGGCKADKKKLCPADQAEIGIWRRTRTRTYGRWMLELPYAGYERGNDGRRRKVSGGQVVLDVALLLESVFDPLIDGNVFESLFVADRSGRVVYQRGAQGTEITEVKALIELARAAEGEVDDNEVYADDVLKVAGIEKVPLAGTTFRLFLHPHSFPVPPSDEATESAGNMARRAPYPWVVGGLISNQSFVSDALAISTTLLALTTIGLLLAIFSFPFVRLYLLGPLQRVRRADALLVVVCAVLGVGLVTVALLDIYAYRGLKKLTDDQLERLAESVERDLGREIGAASRFLDEVESRLASGSSSDQELADLLRAGDDPARDHPYPIFRSVALIDKGGRQLWKRQAGGGEPTPLISVAERAYFRSPVGGRLWEGEVDDADPEDSAPPGFYLETIHSRTTGQLEAVLARPTSAMAPDDRRTQGAVIALTMPLWSLIDTAPVRGFGFAVIDAEGRVIAHSVKRKSLHEDFFEETDQNRKIRSAVAALRADWANMRYSGRDYRAYAAPLGGLPWTIVTFYDKQLLRTVNMEWLFGSILLLVFYVAFMVTVGGVVMLCWRSTGADWLWPDPEYPRAYLRLIFVLLLLGGAFAIGIHSLSSFPLLGLSVLVPPAAFLGYYLTLRARSTRPVSWWVGQALSVLLLVAGSLLLLRGGHELLESAQGEAIVAATLWLLAVLLTFVPKTAGSRAGARSRPGSAVATTFEIACYLLAIVIAILPAISFFKTAHRIQVESYVKYGQLEIARMWQQHRERARDLGLPAVSRDERTFGSYYSYFHGTRRCRQNGASAVLCQTDDDGAPQPEGRLAQGPRGKALPSFLEAILPHHSRYSVRMRKLLHDRSSDESRVWSIDARRLELSTDGGGPTWRSDVRRLMPDRADLVARPLHLPPFLLGFGLFLVAAYWPVSVISKRIFLLDLLEPLWFRRHGALPSRSGENFYVVLRLHEKATWLFDRQRSYRLKPAMFAAVFGDDDRRARALNQIFSKPNRPILWEETENRVASESQSETTLAFLESAVADYRRTVILVSDANPTLLAGTLAHGRQELHERWSRLFERFTVVDADRLRERRRSQGASSRPTVSSLRKSSEGLSDLVDQLSLRRARGIFDRESAVDPYLAAIVCDLKVHLHERSDVPLEAGQVLDEIEERAASYYETLWQDSSPEERVVLVHLALDGLVGSDDRRQVRSLLARGLVRRDPRLRLMNETFRRFVLSSARRAEIQELEKQATELSTWERFKWPFAAVLIVAVVFFLATQRELFDATIGVITGLAAGLPALIRLLGTVGGRMAAGAK